MSSMSRPWQPLALPRTAEASPSPTTQAYGGRTSGFRWSPRMAQSGVAEPRIAERRWPTYVALFASALYVLAVQSGAYDPKGNSAVDDVVFLITAPLVAGLSIALGLLPDRRGSLLGLLALSAA